MKKLLFGILLTAALVSASSASASWNPPPARIGAVPLVVASALDGYDAAGTSSTPYSLYNGTNWCRTVTAYRKYVSLAGWPTYYTYYESVHWCANYAKQYITSSYRNRWVSCCGSVWHFDGNIYSNCSLEHCDNRGKGSSYGQDITQGQFHACVLWACKAKTPYISLTFYASGFVYPYTSG